MRFRLGFMMGFGAGYVAGTAAGRERYEQIKGNAKRIWESERLEPLREQAEKRIVQLEGRGNGAMRTMSSEPTVGEVPPQEPFAATSDRDYGGPIGG